MFLSLFTFSLLLLLLLPRRESRKGKTPIKAFSRMPRGSEQEQKVSHIVKMDAKETALAVEEQPEQTETSFEGLVSACFQIDNKRYYRN